jgi:hypothetical protein
MNLVVSGLLNTIQNVQVVQNVLNDWNYLNDLNAD